MDQGAAPGIHSPRLPPPREVIHRALADLRTGTSPQALDMQPGTFSPTPSHCPTDETFRDKIKVSTQEIFQQAAERR